MKAAHSSHNATEPKCSSRQGQPMGPNQVPHTARQSCNTYLDYWAMTEHQFVRQQGQPTLVPAQC